MRLITRLAAAALRLPAARTGRVTVTRDVRVRVRVPVALWPTAHRFAPGHRLRVQVSGGAHPRCA